MRIKVLITSFNLPSLKSKKNTLREMKSTRRVNFFKSNKMRKKEKKVRKAR